MHQPLPRFWVIVYICKLLGFSSIFSSILLYFHLCYAFSEAAPWLLNCCIEFLSQTAVPPLRKATKVARLQLACKPDSSSSQRALLLNVMHLCSPFHLPFFIAIISHSHFFIPHSWFYLAFRMLTGRSLLKPRQEALMHLYLYSTSKVEAHQFFS